MDFNEAFNDDDCRKVLNNLVLVWALDQFASDMISQFGRADAVRKSAAMLDDMLKLPPGTPIEAHNSIGRGVTRAKVVLSFFIKNRSQK